MLEALRQTLRKEVGPSRFSTWFADSGSLSEGDNRVQVHAGSPFELDLLRRQFREEIGRSVQQVYGKGVSVTYSVHQGQDQPVGNASQSESAPSSVADKSASAPRVSAPRQAKLDLSADVFQDWIEGESNREATRLAHRLVSGQCPASPVLIWGPSGCGKSNLVKAIAEGARRRDRRLRVLSLSAEDFLVAFVDAVRGGGLPSFRQKHRGVGLFLLDNVHQLLGKQRTTEEFLQTVDSLASQGAQIVLTSDRSREQLRELGPELASRLAAGVTTEVQLPDSEMRLRLLTAEAERRGVDLSDEALRLLSLRLTGGAREAQGALNRALLLAETFDTPFDTDLAERVAEDLNRLSTPPVKLEDIQRAVCGVFGVDAAALRSNKRTKAVTEPRMLAMWLARKLTGSAWSEIGDYFGRRSHSTVISAHRRVERLLAGPQPARLSTPAASDLGDAIRKVEAKLRCA